VGSTSPSPFPAATTRRRESPLREAGFVRLRGKDSNLDYRVWLLDKRVTVNGMSAAARALFFIALALGGVSSGAAAAGAQVVDPIGTVTSAISTITSQTTIVSDLTGGSGDGGDVTDAVSGSTGSVSGSTDAVSGATGAVSGSNVVSGAGTTEDATSGAGGGSGSASRSDTSSGSATSSNPRSPRTKFDRLPRRYETLLERIESGRHVRANIARLRALLAQASPELRARVMRLIRLEIRRLGRGGLTGRERGAAQRLRRLLATLQAQPSQPATQRSISLVRVESSGIPTAIPTAIPTVIAIGSGVLSATGGSESRGAERPPANGGDGARIANPTLPLPLPPSPSGLPYWLLLLLVAAIAGLLLLLAGASRRGRPMLLAGASRHVLPLPGRGVDAVPREIWMVAGVVALGLLAGLATALLIAAVLL
jgi:hypothetical protein